MLLKTQIRLQSIGCPHFHNFNPVDFHFGNYRISSNKRPRGVQFSGETFIRNTSNTHLKTPKTIKNINPKNVVFTQFSGATITSTVLGAKIQEGRLLGEGH